MCGICGTFQFDGRAGDELLIDKMSRTLSHRGPDDQGMHTAPYIGLGQRRLAIIDLSRNALAPLPNEDESIWVILNGEIYNFQELRADLCEKGHAFRSSTDTEVLVHLYEEYGTECVHHLRGMFAFVIWDARKKELFAARDRFGKKPFYYTKTSSAFIFGSEIKAITAHPDVSSAPNFAAIDAYLSYEYVPSPLTAFVGIYKLPPAHTLTCKADGDLQIEQYWSPPFSPEKIAASRAEIGDEILRLLRESVRLRLISDVPLGAFLSGGIDSGAIVALMAMESSQPVKTFSIGFEEDDFNELPYARQVAERYGAEHHEFIVRPDAAETLPLLVKHYNEPFADPSALPTYHVSRMTRQYVTVALSGDGGDESFSGYGHYGQMMRWAKTDYLPLAVRKPFSALMNNLLEPLPYSNLKTKATKGLRMLGAQLPERYFLQMMVVKAEEKAACYTPYFRSLIGSSNGSNGFTKMSWDKSMDSLDWMMRHDQSFLLPDAFMVKADIASMANSLELRCPFLDHKLVEFAAGIPSYMKRNGSGGKIILKEAVQGLLPPEVLNKPKTGFGIPLSKWFRNELADLVKSNLLDQRSIDRGLFKQSFLKKMVSEHLDGKRDWSSRLWTFLMLELWFREFID